MCLIFLRIYRFSMNKNNKIKRRDFFKIAATSGAAVAVASCTNDPVEKILPSLLPPDNYQTGVALLTFCFCLSGMLLTVRYSRKN